jgi:hypothetical protein
MGKVVLPTHKPTQNTTLPIAQQEMAIAISCFGLTHSLQTKTRNLFGNIGNIWKITPKLDRNNKL